MNRSRTLFKWNPSNVAVPRDDSKTANPMQGQCSSFIGKKRIIYRFWLLLKCGGIEVWPSVPQCVTLLAETIMFKCVSKRCETGESGVAGHNQDIPFCHIKMISTATAMAANVMTCIALNERTVCRIINHNRVRRVPPQNIGVMIMAPLPTDDKWKKDTRAHQSRAVHGKCNVYYDCAVWYRHDMRTRIARV